VLFQTAMHIRMEPTEQRDQNADADSIHCEEVSCRFLAVLMEESRRMIAQHVPGHHGK
jgi:hypothetical protein